MKMARNIGRQVLANGVSDPLGDLAGDLCCRRLWALGEDGPGHPILAEPANEVDVTNADAQTGKNLARYGGRDAAPQPGLLPHVDQQQ